MDGKRFIEVDKGETGTYMKREYIGMDAQFSFFEFMGNNLFTCRRSFRHTAGNCLQQQSPNTGTRPENLPENALFKRPFIGYFFYLVQDIGTSPFSAVLKYDVYDPEYEAERK